MNDKEEDGVYGKTAMVPWAGIGLLELKTGVYGQHVIETFASKKGL
jgi:hypothetical protein